MEKTASSKTWNDQVKKMNIDAKLVHHIELKFNDRTAKVSISDALELRNTLIKLLPFENYPHLSVNTKATLNATSQKLSTQSTEKWTKHGNAWHKSSSTATVNLIDTVYRILSFDKFMSIEEIANKLNLSKSYVGNACAVLAQEAYVITQMNGRLKTFKKRRVRKIEEDPKPKIDVVVPNKINLDALVKAKKNDLQNMRDK